MTPDLPTFLDSLPAEPGGPGASPRGAPWSAEARNPALVRTGECIAQVMRYEAEDISRFATLTLDRNPVHHDREAARRAGQHDVIASGQHTSALMSGLAATHFSRRDDGVARDMLCLHFNFSYRAPIHAGRDVRLLWEVREVEWNETLGGFIAQLIGQARVESVVAVVGRGTVLVRAAADLGASLPARGTPA